MALVALGGTLVALLLVVAVNAAVSVYVDVRHRRRIARVRPAVIALAAADDAVDAAALMAPLRGADVAALEDVAGEFLTKIRGAGRAALVELLDELGLAERARRRLTRPGAVGRARAAAVLGQLGDASDVPALAGRLSDRDPEVRLVAARALGELATADAVEPLLSSLHGRRALPLTTVTMWLAAIGPAAVEPLCAALHHRDPMVRMVAAELLGHYGALQAVPDLLVMVADGSQPGTRQRAARALGQIGSPKAVPELIRMLTDDPPGSPELRRALVAALADIGDPGTADVLAGTLEDSDHATARGAARALAGIGAPGIARLRAAAEQPSRGGAYARETLALHDLAEARRGERRR